MTTGEAGTREQARGLATALAINAEERLIKVDRLWALAPPRFLRLAAPSVTSTVGRLEPPWPQVLVTCGRRSALVAMTIRRRNPAPMVMIHVQPPTYPNAFDLVVAMAHDGLQGPNVLQVDTAMHGIRPTALAAAAACDDPRYVGLPRPWTGVLLGGSTKRSPFTYDDAVRLAGQLDDLRRQIGGSLLITPSRRTPTLVVAALGARYLSDQTVRIWDGAAPNPYMTMLALADRLVVTSDSVSMVSEALATSAPVSVFHLPGGRRHAQFIENLTTKGLVTPLEAAVPITRREPLDATPAVVESARRLIAERLYEHASQP